MKEETMIKTFADVFCSVVRSRISFLFILVASMACGVTTNPLEAGIVMYNTRFSQDLGNGSYFDDINHKKGYEYKGSKWKVDGYEYYATVNIKYQVDTMAVGGPEFTLLAADFTITHGMGMTATPSYFGTVNVGKTNAGLTNYNPMYLSSDGKSLVVDVYDYNGMFDGANPSDDIAFSGDEVNNYDINKGTPVGDLSNSDGTKPGGSNDRRFIFGVKLKSGTWGAVDYNWVDPTLDIDKAGFYVAWEGWEGNYSPDVPKDGDYEVGHLDYRTEASGKFGPGTAVPEPSSIGMFALGLAIFFPRRRRRKKIVELGLVA